MLPLVSWFFTAAAVGDRHSLETLNHQSDLLPEHPTILDFAVPFHEYINLDPSLRLAADLSSLRIPLPRSPVDHKAAQTPVRDQGLRPTCVAHAALAAMEAHLAIAGLNLSEEYAQHMFMNALGSNCCLQPGLNGRPSVDVNTVDAARYLSKIEIPLDNGQPWSYNPKWPMCLDRTDCYSPQHDSQPVPHPTYHLAAFDVISDKTGLSGPSIKNTAYLEVLLASGYDVVVAMDKAWQEGAEAGIIDVDMVGGAPRQSRSGHAMLLVGYDRTAGYFVAKNSFGPTWGHSGYAYLSYAFLATYARYGFIVTSVT